MHFSRKRFFTPSPSEYPGISDDKLTNRYHECDYASEAFASLQYSFFTNSGVEVLGGILFLVGAIFIVRDRRACEEATKDAEKSASELYELK